MSGEYFGIKINIPPKDEVEVFVQKGIFPYWAQLWPSAIALSEFITEHNALVASKNVLELAAGLGLPSMVASRYAEQVLCTDYATATLSYINNTITENKLINVNAAVYDWNNLPNNLSCDILLLSDVNYDNTQFEKLTEVILIFLKQGTTVLLSSPHRLMAKAFINNLLPYEAKRKDYEIANDNTTTAVTVWQLQ